VILSRGTLGLILLCVATATLGTAAYLFAEHPRPEPIVENRPIQVRDDGYVSSQTCKACHPDQYASWHDSYHRTMTQVATPATAQADFSDVVVNDVHGRPMRLSERGNELWAEFDDPDTPAGAGEPARVSRQVVMITGSHHQQIFWYATGRKRLLGQLPGAYLIAERRWIPRRMAVLHPPNETLYAETGHWNSTCIACHATHGKPQFDTPFGSQPIDTQSVDTTVGELGIACESCHGPSEAHVRANRNPLRRYGRHLAANGPTPDATIVQPTRLAPKLSSQACGQCHGVWEFYDRAGERHANASGLPYRPGGELVKTRFLAQPTTNGDAPTMKTLLEDDPNFVRDSFWADGMVRVSGREYNGLIESPCFKNASTEQRTMTCFSCHVMHKPKADTRGVREWANDQLTAGMDGDNACLQCHEPMRAKVAAHTKHAADSAGSRCYNCHMPYTTYGLLKTIRSHTVSSPSVSESVSAGRPNACNLCHLDKTLEWTAKALAQWYGTPPVPLSDEQKTTAASLLWLLRGDAGQRAITAQAMAWLPAQQASGSGWMAPHLATLLDDPYDAVRFIAGRSLRTLPGFEQLPYDFVSSPKERYQAQMRTMSTWDRGRQRPGRTDPQLLVKPDGSVDVDRVLALLKVRDSRRMLLRE
jgi:hypothetical protein